MIVLVWVKSNTQWWPQNSLFIEWTFCYWGREGSEATKHAGEFISALIVLMFEHLCFKAHIQTHICFWLYGKITKFFYFFNWYRQYSLYKEGRKRNRKRCREKNTLSALKCIIVMLNNGKTHSDQCLISVQILIIIVKLLCYPRHKQKGW